MTSPKARRLVLGLWLLMAVLFLGSATFALLEDVGGALAVLFIGLPIAIYGTVGGLVARRRPQNPIGWLFCAIALSLVVWLFGRSYADVGGGLDALGTLPGAAVAAWIGLLAPMAVLPAALPIFFLVFPDGHLRSRGWRIAVAVALVGGMLATLGMAATIARYSGSLPLVAPGWMEQIPASRGFLATGLALAAAAALAGLVCIGAGFRAAEGDRREQLRLLFWMLVAMAVAPLLVLPLAWVGLILVFLVDGGGILLGIPAATAIAVLTFGLYDVGVVVKKTIVYGLIVVLVTVFVALVIFFASPVGLLGARGGDGEGAVARLISGIVLVALTVAATWGLTRRIAKRLVYGRRATPYEAMSEFSERLGEAYSTEDVLPRMAEIVRASTGADVARVWLRVGTELLPAASAPSNAPSVDPIVSSGDDLGELPSVRAFPVRHVGELLGALTVAMPPAEPLSKTGEKLVADLAAQAGLVLRNVRLTEELRGTIGELRASRQRIVTAQDERARKLERDLHDGAQQQIVALTVKLRLAEQLTDRDPAKARELLAGLQAEAGDALENLRDLARGIYPPLLADRGLATALEAQARKASLPVALEPDGVGRYAPEIEAAVYFSCLEALQNIAKYANASHATVRLAESNGQLVFEIADDGAGFEVDSTPRGSGLTHMRDRLESLGGALEIRSRAGEGTIVSGRIPTGTVSG